MKRTKTKEEGIEVSQDQFRDLVMGMLDPRVNNFFVDRAFIKALGASKACILGFLRDKEELFLNSYEETDGYVPLSHEEIGVTPDEFNSHMRELIKDKLITAKVTPISERYKVDSHEAAKLRVSLY